MRASTNGRDCGLPAAEAFCKYIGFDGATPDMQQTAPADEPVRAVSGIISCCVSSRPESICSQCLDPLGLARCIFTLLLYWHARHTGAPENSLLGCCSQQGLPGISNNCTPLGLRGDICTPHVQAEWCVSQGNYQNLGALNRTQFDDLATVNANSQHCNRLTSATCFRSRESMGKVFTQLQANATKAAAQTPVQVRKPTCAIYSQHGTVLGISC